MHRLAIPVALFAALLAAVLWLIHSAPLPMPTPAQQDLVVLMQPGPLTYDDSDPENISGLEHDLVELFARELGVGVHYVLAGPASFANQFNAGTVHLAASWLTPGGLPNETPSPPFLDSLDVLIQHEASLPIDEEAELAGRKIHVIADSRQATVAKALKERLPDLEVVEHAGMLPFTLLEAVAEQRYDLAIVDESYYAVALQFAPALQATLEFGKPQPLTWVFPKNANQELQAKANEFLQRLQKDPALERIKDRYFGHIRRLRNEDIAKLLERSKSVLPKLKPYFQSAQISTGIDWRLLAALAYQESQWDANATSPTGVRGIMMLTEETADRLKVSNRLDPKESILAGAQYLDYLRSQLPSTVTEPDRTWQALAAYNLGPGHYNAARTIGKQRKADTESWFEMKAVLPLLAKPEFYQRLKSGRARGGEAVIMVENIRSFYDVLVRQEAPYRPLSPPEDPKPENKPGLKIKTDGPGLKRG